MKNISSALPNDTYNDIYKEYQFLPNDILIEKWKRHQQDIRYKEDDNWIASSVCQDILRQRGNTYLDDTYPKD